MKTREELRIQLIENRLMQKYEQTDLFEEAMNKLYETNDLDNIAYYCEAFDDSTAHKEVMIGMIHGIENYDNIFSPELAINKLISSVTLFNNNSNEWQETIFLRILNDEKSREILKSVLKNAPKAEQEVVISILNRVKDRDKTKFETNVTNLLHEIR